MGNPKIWSWSSYLSYLIIKLSRENCIPPIHLATIDYKHKLKPDHP